MKPSEKSDKYKLLLYYRGTTEELKSYVFNRARNAYLATLAMQQKRQKKTAPA